MNAVAADKARTNTTENGVPKVAKKKNKNHRKHRDQQKSIDSNAPTEEIHDTKIVKNGTIPIIENGQDTVEDLIGQLKKVSVQIKENGCDQGEHNHALENGETTESVGSKKTRSRNQRKKLKKYGLNSNSSENGTHKCDKESAAVNNSDKLISSNNNIIEKNTQPEADCCETNGSSNNRAPVIKTKAVKNPDSKPLPTAPPESKTPLKSSPSKSSPSPQASQSPSSSSKPETPVLIPTPSTSRTQPSVSSSSSREDISSKAESQEAAVEKKEEEGDLPTASTSSAAEEPPAEPSEEEGAVGGIDRSNIVIEYKQYESELQMQDIMRLIQSELSEPYSIYTYRYFIYNWPKLCFLAAHGDEYVGAIVCKLDMHMNVKRGYIAMLAVKKEYRKMQIGTTLVEKAIEVMLEDGADEVVLETEMKNTPALRLYENLGFVRDKRLFRYYLNGVDALRLKLWFR